MRLAPESVPAMLGAASLLLEQVNDDHDDADTLGRATALLERARALEPNSEAVLKTTVFLLRTEERWAELVFAAQKLIDAYPNDVKGYHHLANAKLFTGKAEEAIPLLQTALRLDPSDANVRGRYLKIALAQSLLGRNEDAIVWATRFLASAPDADPSERCLMYLVIAVAEASNGRPDEARRALAEANRIWPFSTVRAQVRGDPSNVAMVSQVRRFQEGLRRAGLRDHADENADFGVAPDSALHFPIAGLTPMTAPGTTTIRTQELAAMLAQSRPVVIDAMTTFWGTSVPGAIGLRRAGLHGSFSDGLQDRLRRKMHELTGGDLGRPVVALGWNAERFDGYNLALRLAALGYRQVFWYRGGREAWEASAMPQTSLDVQPW